jgi:hypothetical protein
LGTENRLPDEIFDGVRAITEIEPWHGEGVAELIDHLKAELESHPFSNT